MNYELWIGGTRVGLIVLSVESGEWIKRSAFYCDDCISASSAKSAGNKKEVEEERVESDPYNSVGINSL